MGKLVSIIVPIYNVEEYLEKCINSILKQTLKDIEIILVDDGSTDKSGYLCDCYQKQDKRIVVIHQDNAGLTVARRNGVNLSHGKFVGFVDGDDWIEPQMFERLYMHAIEQNTDIVTSRGYRDYDNNAISTCTLGDSIPQGKYLVDDEKKYLLKHVFSSSFSDSKHLNGAVWNKLFKKSIIKKVLNEMNDNVHGFMDDNVCVVGAVISSKSVYVSYDCFYHHVERKNAFSYSQNPKGLLQVNYAYLDLRKMINDSKYKDILIDLLEEHTSSRIISAYNTFFDKQEFELPLYFFKSSLVPLNSRVLIYGYGNVGKSYFKQFTSEGRYNVVGIVDINAKKMKDDKVVSIEKICEFDYEFIIIANMHREIAQNITEKLLEMNICREKIVWIPPQTIFEYYKN